jgi:hypothetical protein
MIELVLFGSLFSLNFCENRELSCLSSFYEDFFYLRRPQDILELTIKIMKIMSMIKNELTKQRLFQDQILVSFKFRKYHFEICDRFDRFQHIQRNDNIFRELKSFHHFPISNKSNGKRKK